MTQFVVTIPAAELAWRARDVLQVLVTVWDDNPAEADVRLDVGGGWKPVELFGGSVRRQDITP